MVKWEKFNEYLKTELGKQPRPKRLKDLDEFGGALVTIHTVIKATIEAEVPITKPLPYTKRRWNPELNTLHKSKNKLASLSYKWRGLPDHHAHKEHKCATKEYVNLIKSAKRKHWESWLLSASNRDLWMANKYTTDPPTDYGQTRMPSLTHTSQEGRPGMATTNEDKSNALVRALFPPPPTIPAIPVMQYPEPAHGYFNYFTRDQIKLAANKLTAFKAPGPDGIPNVVLKQCVIH